MSSSPSKRHLDAVAQELKGLKPGAQKVVSDGIFMRLDGSGRRRFLARLRVRGRLFHSRTYDSWEEAEDARRELADTADPETAVGPTAAEIRTWTIERYAAEVWWPGVLDGRGDLTVPDYRRGLDDLLPLIRGLTFNQLLRSPLLLDRLRADAKRLKTYPKGHPLEGFRPAAADKVVKTLRMICTHAVKRKILPYNPVADVEQFNKRRSASADADGRSHRRIMPSEVKHPRTVALACSGMRGDPLLLARRRLIPELIVIGMRPSDILATRNRWWRDEEGPLPMLHIDSAVKDLEGHLLEGEPKTGERDLYLFDAIAERLELIYQLAGCPGPDELTFPNAVGGLLDWGNWRTQVWYPALHRAGIADGSTAKARGAFIPYQVRHLGVAAMLHAERHDTDRGTYSEREVARQFGHTVATLDRVYADIPTDLHGIAGLKMDEIIRTARRTVWGPMPGEKDHQQVEYDLPHAAELTGLSNTALAGRIQRGSLPGVKRAGKCYVTHFDLVWHGLLPLSAPLKTD